MQKKECKKTYLYLKCAITHYFTVYLTILCSVAFCFEPNLDLQKIEIKR